MRRSPRLVWLALVLFLAGWAWCEESFRGKVVAIADGDTITVLVQKEQRKIRLHGVDTPERSQDFGTKAKQFTADLVFGKSVEVEIKDMDRYGRHVGVVRLDDGRILNQELVKAGMAWWYVEYAPHDSTLEKLQAEAKKARRGLWQDKNPVPPWEFRKAKRAPKVPEPEPKPSIWQRIFGGGSRTSSDNGAVGADSKNTVYVTPSGKKYHKAGCRYAKSAKAVSLDKVKADGYEPCSICFK